MTLAKVDNRMFTIQTRLETAMIVIKHGEVRKKTGCSFVWVTVVVVRHQDIVDRSICQRPNKSLALVLCRYTIHCTLDIFIPIK